MNGACFTLPAPGTEVPAVQGQADMLAVAPAHMGGKQPRMPWASFRRKLYIAVPAKVAMR